MYTDYRNDLKKCKDICKKHGKSYFFATLFFPKKIKEATFIIYAWMRTFDDIVDEEKSKKEIIQSKIITLEKKWLDSLNKKNVEDPILRACAFVFDEFQIPKKYSFSFINSMKQDLNKTRYQTYKELENYMYGSAGVVGIIMSYIIGFKDDALVYAEKLGYAMQLTNFIRDIKEDYKKRNRIYLPKEDLLFFGIIETDIKNEKMTPNLINLLDYQIKRTELLYTESLKGIKKLNDFGQYPVLLSLFLYRQITRKIKNNNFEIFKKRISTTRIEKIFLSIQAKKELKKMSRPKKADN